MGKGKAKARPAAAEDDSDDALLRAAIAENAAVREKAALESARAQAEQAAREAECAQRDKEGAPLSREASCCLIRMHVHRAAWCYLPPDRMTHTSGDLQPHGRDTDLLHRRRAQAVRAAPRAGGHRCGLNT